MDSPTNHFKMKLVLCRQGSAVFLLQFRWPAASRRSNSRRVHGGAGSVNGLAVPLFGPPVWSLDHLGSVVVNHEVQQGARGKDSGSCPSPSKERDAIAT